MADQVEQKFVPAPGGKFIENYGYVPFPYFQYTMLTDTIL